MSKDSNSHTQERRAILGSATLLSVATMASRVLGLVREHLFARLFGAAGLADCFTIAFRIPNLLRELVAEGAMSASFIPTFTDVRERYGDEAAFRLGNLVFSGLMAGIGGLSLVAYLFTPELVNLIAPGFAQTPVMLDGEVIDKHDQAVFLTRLMIPFLLFAAWASVCRGMLNTHGHYFLPALSPALFNLSSVITGGALLYLGLDKLTALTIWALATLIGGFLQFFIQIWPLRKLGFSFRLYFGFGDPAFLKILRMMAPATLGLAAVQLNIFVTSALASSAIHGNGAVAMLNYAYRLVYLPIGIIGVAIATVATVQVSRGAAQEDHVALTRDLNNSLRYLLFFTLPSTVGLIVLATPIVQLIYGYGEFAKNSDSALLTAQSLICYSWALPAFCAVKVIAPAFYALNRVRVPVIASGTAVAVTIAWSISTHQSWGWQSLAVGTAIGGVVNFLVLGFALRRLLPHTIDRDLVYVGLFSCLATAPMAAGAWFFECFLSDLLGATGASDPNPAWAKTISCMGAIFFAMPIYITATKLFGLREASDVLNAIRRRFSR